MANENKWEYDYSNIYNKPAEPNSYVNVGSSGTNTANQAAVTGAYYAQQPVVPQTPVQEVPLDQTASFEQFIEPSMPTGAVTGMPPPPPAGYQPPQGAGAPPPQRNHKRRAQKPPLIARVLYRAVALVVIAAVGFVGGYVGSVYGMLDSDSTVVVQQVVRDTSDLTTISTSTGGDDLSLVSASALASQSVVVITTEQMVATSSWYGTEAVQSGAGSGVIISEDGYILTCAHVVSDANNIIVTIDDVDYTATLIGSDEETDIAVIKIEATGLTAAVLGDSDALSVGESVIAVGNPLGQLGGSVTQGIVSALNRVIVVDGYEMTLIQMDASVSPGNSGGGLFNMAGELVGIVNAKSSSSDSEGIGFSIPINSAFELATSLIENGYITGRPELGVIVISISDTETAAMYGVNALGIYVYSVNAGSAAEAAGLQAGDRLISIEDVEVSALTDVSDAVEAREVGDVVNLLIARNGQMLTVSVTLGEEGAPTTTSTTTEDSAAAMPDDSAEIDPDMTYPEEGTMPESGTTMPESGTTMPDNSTTMPDSGSSSTTPRW